jgi:hypothetical protein
MEVWLHTFQISVLGEGEDLNIVALLIHSYIELLIYLLLCVLFSSFVTCFVIYLFIIYQFISVLSSLSLLKC